MKGYFKYFSFFILMTHLLNGQDTIFKHDQSKVIGVVSEVGEYVKYKNWNNANGPTYIIPKTDIKAIHYKNGYKEEFGPKLSPFDSEVLQGSTSTPTSTVTSILTAESAVKKKHKEKLLTIYTNLTKNMFNEYNLGFEFGITKYIAVGATFGIIHPNPLFAVFPLATSQNRWPGTVYHGVGCRINLKIYPAGYKSDYWNIQGVYKSMYYRNQSFLDLNNSGYESSARYTRSEDAFVTGISIMHGHEYAAADGVLYIDFFYGFGFRERERNITTLTCEMTPYNSNPNPALGYSKMNQTYPVIETGFKIGFNFLKKSKVDDRAKSLP